MTDYPPLPDIDIDASISIDGPTTVPAGSEQTYSLSGLPSDAELSAEDATLFVEWYVDNAKQFGESGRTITVEIDDETTIVARVYAVPADAGLGARQFLDLDDITVQTG